MDQPSSEFKNTNYELFIAALSILSIVNLAILVLVEATGQDPVVANITYIINVPLSVIFLADFGFRLKTAHSRSRYFFKEWGWSDLLASLPLPQFKILRLTRLFRAGRLMRAHGGRKMLKDFLADRAGSALLVVLFLLLLVVEFGGMFVYLADRSSPDANIKTASDAVWWAYITVTTIGYGDRYPVTNAGRAWALAVAACGVGLFGVLTGYLANAFLSPKEEEADAGGDARPAPGPAPADSTAALAEIARLLTEQRQAQAGLIERMAALERLLAAATAAEEGRPGDAARQAGPTTQNE
jgi:voltage-gated potassium channel